MRFFDHLAHRVFIRVIGKPFLRGLVLPIAAIVLSVAMADAVVDWTLARGRVAAMPPLERTVVMTALVLVWSLTAGQALRPVWRQRTVAFLVRQPLTRWQWLVYLLPSLASALIPVAGIWWFVPRSVDSVFHYLGFLGLAVPIVLGASYRAWDAVLVTSLAVVVFFCVTLAYAFAPVAAYGAPIVAAIAAGFAVTPIRRQIVAIGTGFYRPLSGSGVVVTIARRDVRYLWRTERRRLAGVLALSLVSAAMMLAFRVNGNEAGREAFLLACLFFTVSASPTYEILEALKAGLGKEIMRQRWPVSFAQRTWALLAVIAVLTGPAAVGVLVAGSSMGPGHVVAYLLFTGATATLIAALVAALLLARRSANGLFLLLITGHVVSLLWLPVWAYALVAAAWIPIGFALIARAFARFTAVTERMSIEQLA